MTPRHVACAQPITFRVVIADDGDAVIVGWCAGCDCVLGEDDTDPAWGVADVPAELIANLISGAITGTGRVQ